MRAMKPNARMQATLVLMLVAATLMPAPAARSSGPATHALRAYRGHVVPSREVELMAPIEEVVARVEVREGQRVRQGQIIAVFEDDLQRAVTEAARIRSENDGEMLRTAVDLREAQVNRSRMERAYGQGAATDVELDRSRFDAERAEHVHDAATELLRLAGATYVVEQRRLERHRVRAPFDGTVVRIQTESGAMLSKEDVILRLADLDTLEARINLPAELYGELIVGATYTLQADAPVMRDLRAELEHVDPVIDTASQTFRATFHLPNRGEDLPAGFVVSLAWPPTAPTTDVPPQAVSVPTDTDGGR